MQRAFYSLALEICKVNGLDISPEVNAGSGPVDFKFSLGIARKVLVEIKKSSSKTFLKNFQNQLVLYAQSNDTHKVVFLVLKTSKNSPNIDKAFELRNKAQADGKIAPSIVVVDIQPQDSASKVEKIDSDEEEDEG
jgi:hypothetical protein